MELKELFEAIKANTITVKSDKDNDFREQTVISLQGIADELEELGYFKWLDN